MPEEEQVESDSRAEVDWSALRDLVGDDRGDGPARLGRTVRAVGVGLWVASLLLIWITWDQVASRADVADQLPWLASGGLCSIVLAIMGGAVLVVGSLPRDR